MEMPLKTTRQRDALVHLDALVGALNAMPVRHSGKHCGTVWAGDKAPPKDFICMAGGKSMLMDLFFDKMPMKAKGACISRLMQETHARIHDTPKARSDRRPDAACGARNCARSEAFVLTNFGQRTLPMPPFWGVCLRFCSTGVVVVATIGRRTTYKDGLNRHRFMPFIDLLKMRTHY